MARWAYLKGRIEVDEFERCVEHVLAGGHLNQQGLIPGTPTHPDLPP
jgi:hypothetical protein